MLFKRNKIKENTKKLPFRRNQSNYNTSGWDSLSIIEQFCLIVMPCMLCFIIYIILEMTGLIWWLRLIISAIVVGGFMGLITLIVNYFHEI
tara:strand:+ start:210 stop:482 length:273 start_codon:yes stop_codon:yes gene_type:complete